MKKILYSTLSLLAFAGLSANSLHAQAVTEKDIADLAVKHSAAMKANREVLKNYSNSYRIEVSKAGELQWIDLVNVQIGADQNAILTQVNRDVVVPQEHGLLGRKRRKQEKGAEEMDRVMAYAMKWVTYYNRLPADRVFTLFLQAAKDGTTKVATYSPDVLGVWSTNVRNSNANDKVKLWFNKQNGQPIRLSFDTPVEKGLDGATGETIKAMISYRYLKDGKGFYPAHIDVTIPSRGLTIKVEHLAAKKKD